MKENVYIYIYICMYFKKYMVNEISRQKRTNIVQFHFHEITRRGKLIETGDGIDVTSG